MQVGRDGPLREVRVLGPDPRLELDEGQVAEGRRREGGPARFPGRVGVGKLDDPAIDADDAPDDVGVAPGQLENHVATPGLAGQDRPPEPECLDERDQVPNGDVVSILARRSIRSAVAALIESDDRVAACVQTLGHRVPQAEVGRQAMDEHEGYGVRIAVIPLHVERDVRCDRYPSLARPHGRSLRGLVRHGCRGILSITSAGASGVGHSRSEAPLPLNRRGGFNERGELAGGSSERGGARMRMAGVLIWTEAAHFESMVRFYRDTLGLRPRSVRDDFINFEWGDVRLSVGIHEGVRGRTRDPVRVMVNFAVDDIHATYERLRAVGTHFTRAPETEDWGGIVATFGDPDGNVLQLMQLPA